jgi:hypothetical protein
VRAERRAAPSLRTTTLSAGRRAHAANSPNSTTVTASNDTPRRARNDQNAFRSRAYASTVFGERSICVNHAKNSSITATGARSGPITVHDSTPLKGNHRRRTSNPDSRGSLTSLTTTAARTYARTGRTTNGSARRLAEPRATAAPGGDPLDLRRQRRPGELP